MFLSRNKKNIDTFLLKKSALSRAMLLTYVLYFCFSYRYIIPIFVWVLTFCIVFALKYVQPVVSVLTFFKGSLLLGTVSFPSIYCPVHNTR